MKTKIKQIIRAVRRLWLVGTCDHRNCIRVIQFDDTTEIGVCRRCGMVTRFIISDADKGQSRPLAAHII